MMLKESVVGTKNGIARSNNSLAFCCLEVCCDQLVLILDDKRLEEGIFREQFMCICLYEFKVSCVFFYIKAKSNDRQHSRNQNISVFMLQKSLTRFTSLPSMAATSSPRQSRVRGDVVLYRAAYIEVSML